jgi:hypothetical protein
MLDAFLRAARASREKKFTWHRVGQYASRLLHEASPRALVLVFPYIRWDWLADRGDLIQRWAAAVSAVPYTEEVGSQCGRRAVANRVSRTALLPHIPVDVWSWLTKRPPLPPICLGRYVGTCTQCRQGCPGTQRYRDSQVVLPPRLVRVEPVLVRQTVCQAPPPLHVIPSSHYLPPASIDIPILQPPILDLPSIPVSMPTRHSSSSPSSTLSHHMHNGSDRVSDHCPLPLDSTLSGPTV